MKRLKRGFHEPINLTDEMQKILVSAIDLISLPTNIDNLSIVLCSPIRY